MQAAAQSAGCWQCGAAPADVLACAGCGAPQPLAADVDLFAVLGLPRRLTVDAADVENRHHARARLVHPDRHQAGAAQAQALSVAASTALNRAARTLRDPVARGRYWLELHGTPLGSDNNRVPPGLAAQVFETQETLEALRDAPGDAALRRAVLDEAATLASRVDGLVRALQERYAQWDAADPAAASALDELKRRLSEVAYLRTLQRDVDQVLGG